MNEEKRDAIAQAICKATASGRMFPWETQTESERDAWRRMADAALEAITEEDK